MPRISGPDLDSNNVTMLQCYNVTAVSLVSVSTELRHFLTNIYYQLHSCSTWWMWIQASTSNCPFVHSFRIPENSIFTRSKQTQIETTISTGWYLLILKTCSFKFLHWISPCPRIECYVLRLNGLCPEQAQGQCAGAAVQSPDFYSGPGNLNSVMTMLCFPARGFSLS